MKAAIFILFSLFLSLLSNAQSAEQQVIAASGNHGASATHQLSWTIGEPVIETAVATNNSLTQGFHQTNLVITDVSEPGLAAFEMTVFPNPSMDFIYLNVSNRNQQMAEYILYDETGRILQQKQIVEDISMIDLNTLASAAYFLVISSNSGVVKTFKVVKQN
jgi:hypothetical protein